MWETIWDDLLEKYNEMMRTLSEYSEKVNSGMFLACDDELDAQFIVNVVTAHIINLLTDDDDLYIPDKEVLVTLFQQSAFAHHLEAFDGDGYRLFGVSYEKNIVAELLESCFDERGKNFIQEVCAQDIVYGGELAKKIASFMRTINSNIEIAVKGEEAFFRSLSAMREGIRYSTKIQQKYEREYRNRGALIRNRVFKHCYNGRKIVDRINLNADSDDVLDYRKDRNFCQSALLHIGVEAIGSSGTGFVISEDGYALTCAHVVEGAKEIYATVINSDGYPVGGHEGFEVYDAGDGEVVYINKTLDIALLKMNHFGFGFLPIEEKDILPELGEEVVVFGYPLGYEMPQSNSFGPNISFYRGYVSSNQVRDGNSVTFLDIDVKSGNSGSPVISVKTGKVIGIMSGIKVGGRIGLNEKMPYMIPIQHFIKLQN